MAWCIHFKEVPQAKLVLAITCMWPASPCEAAAACSGRHTGARATERCVALCCVAARRSSVCTWCARARPGAPSDSFQGLGARQHETLAAPCARHPLWQMSLPPLLSPTLAPIQQTTFAGGHQTNSTGRLRPPHGQRTSPIPGALPFGARFCCGSTGRHAGAYLALTTRQVSGRASGTFLVAELISFGRDKEELLRWQELSRAHFLPHSGMRCARCCVSVALACHTRARALHSLWLLPVPDRAPKRPSANRPRTRSLCEQKKPTTGD